MDLDSCSSPFIKELLVPEKKMILHRRYRSRAVLRKHPETMALCGRKKARGSKSSGGKSSWFTLGGPSYDCYMVNEPWLMNG